MATSTMAAMRGEIPIRSKPQISNLEYPVPDLMKRRRGRRQNSRFFKDKFFYYKGELYLRKRRKSKNKCECSNLVLVDRISEMPCEILVNVLSLLPLKEAAATSILSRRWRYVWESTMTLTFDAINILAGGNYQSFLLTFMELEEKLKDEKIRNYVNWVNRVVEQHRGSKIERFSAGYFLDLRYSSSIDEWIRFAMEKSVEILELDLSPGTSFPLDSKNSFPCYQKDGFPQYLLRLEKLSDSGQLYSDTPNLRSCGYDIGFKSLKVLHLRNVGVTGEVLEYFLSNCPVLEQLSAIVSRNLVSLRVVGPSIALKYLLIENCPCIKTIEICDVNIVSFSYIGYDTINLLFSKLPMLVEVSLAKRLHVFDCLSLAFTQLSCYVSQIQFLTLDIKGAIPRRNVTFPTLANLKYLELIVCAQFRWSLDLLSSFIKASPYLPRLVLKLTYLVHRAPGEIKEVIESHRHNLKVVEIVGYRGITCAIQHVKYLIENAVALEKLVINPVQARQLPPIMDREIELSREEEKARDHAKQYLKPKLNLPSTVEFVCM